MADRNSIAQAIAQQRMRDIDTYNRIMATPPVVATPQQRAADPTLNQMELSNEMLRASPRVFDSYMQGVSMPEDPRIRAYRGMQ